MNEVWQIQDGQVVLASNTCVHAIVSIQLPARGPLSTSVSYSGIHQFQHHMAHRKQHTNSKSIRQAVQQDNNTAIAESLYNMSGASPQNGYILGCKDMHTSFLRC